jgi:hypothetical protein
MRCDTTRVSLELYTVKSDPKHARSDMQPCRRRREEKDKLQGRRRSRHDARLNRQADEMVDQPASFAHSRVTVLVHLCTARGGRQCED